ncbi:MAG: EAL domain-containing protein [Lachnospiraceae bacterium]|nr:EAL domain-containing protein [Lachnospiraceae bacterium]
MAKKLKKAGMIFSIITFIVVVIAAMGWHSGEPEDVMLTYMTKSSEGNFVNVETGKPFTEKSVSIKGRSTLTIEKEMKEEIWPGASLIIYDPGLHITVFADGQKFFESGDRSHRGFGNETGPVWRAVSLEHLGKFHCLTIKLENLNAVSVKVFSKEILVGDQNDAIYYLLSSSFITHMQSFIYLGLTLVLLFITLYLKKAGYHKEAEIMGALCTTTLLMGLWVINDSSLGQLVVDAPSFRYALCHICLFLVPIFLGKYFKNVVGMNDVVYWVFQSVYELELLIAIVLHMFNVVSLMVTIRMVLVLFSLEMIYIGYKIVKNFKEKVTFLSLCNLVELMIIIILCGSASFILTYGDRRMISVIEGIGFLGLMVLISMSEITLIFRKYSAGQKKRNFKEMSRIDPVTGGNTRTVAGEWLRNSDEKSLESMWMLYMNLRDYKSINALVGRNNGNNILKGIYENNLKLLDEDEMQCNIGDACFIFFLKEQHGIFTMCRNLNNTLTAYMGKCWDGILLAAEYTAVKVKTEDSLDSLLDKVHIANSSPYADYDESIHCTYYNDRCQEEVARRLKLRSMVPKAIMDDEFQMYLQPKVNPLKGSLTGAEALVRWRSSDGNMIMPGQFIPVIEESGQVEMVDWIMFQQVCGYLVQRRKEQRPDIMISVNLSKRGISKKKFFKDYAHLIQEMNVPAECLEFELTESRAFENIGDAKDLIEKIHSMGAKVSLDDFGSGFSNIEVIGALQFDVIKMDKSIFSTGFPQNKQTYTLVKGLIQMFHDMDIKVVCEGIESQEQAEALKELGADMIQGYYYAKPMSVEDFATWEKKSEKEILENGNL